jgi:hypothetical protein
MNTALAYLTYALVIAVPAGLVFTGLIPLVRRLQLSFQPHSAHIAETETEPVARFYAHSQAILRALASAETALRQNMAEVTHVGRDPYIKGRGSADLGSVSDQIKDASREFKEKRAAVADQQIKGVVRETYKGHVQGGSVADQIKGAAREDWGRVQDDVGVDPYSVKGRVQSQAEEHRRDKRS